MSPDFIEFTKQIGNISSELKNALHNRLTIQYLERGTILLNEGEVCNTSYFIVKGTGRFFYTVNNKEITNRFMQKGMAAVSYYSYFSGNPAFESFHLLEDSTIVPVDREVFDGLCNDFPELKEVLRVFMEKAQIASEERAMILRRVSAQERFEALKLKFPRIFKIASTEQIASFLGITRETLSRIQSQSLRKKGSE